MRALSVRQPYAEQIAIGAKRTEYRDWAPRVIVGEDLLIVASRTPEAGGERLPVGVAICVVHVDAIVDDPDGGYGWKLSNPRRVEPIEIRGRAAIFHVADETLIELASSPMPATEARRVLRTAGRAIARQNARAKRAAYTFQDGDRKIRGKSAVDMSSAREIAREIADELGDYVYIMRDGINVGGEWHEAERDS